MSLSRKVTDDKKKIQRDKSRCSSRNSVRSTHSYSASSGHIGGLLSTWIPPRFFSSLSWKGRAQPPSDSGVASHRRSKWRRGCGGGKSEDEMSVHSNHILYGLRGRRGGEKTEHTLVRRPGVQYVRITQELNIAHLQHHVQRQLLARLLKHRQRMDLRLAQRRNNALVTESRQALDKVRVPLAVHTSLAARLQKEDGRLDPLVLALADLALAVKVPDGLGQQLGHVRVLALQRVPDVVHADNVALAALLRAVAAQQADNVARVGVEELPRRRAVDAHAVDLRRVVAHVLDVAQHVAPPVLADEVAQVRAQAHVGHGVLVWAPLAGGEPLEEDEALAVEEVLAEGLEDLAEFGQGEVVLEGVGGNVSLLRKDMCMWSLEGGGGQVLWRCQSMACRTQ